MLIQNLGLVYCINVIYPIFFFALLILFYNDKIALSLQVHEELVELQVNIQQQQTVIDQLGEDVSNTRRLVERSRPPTQRAHPDVDRLEQEVQRVTSRWAGVCSQVAER